MTVWKLGSRGLRPRDSRGQGMRRGVGCRPRGLAHHEAPGWWTMRLLGALWISCVYSSAASACLRPRAAAPRQVGSAPRCFSGCLPPCLPVPARFGRRLPCGRKQPWAQHAMLARRGEGQQAHCSSFAARRALVSSFLYSCQAACQRPRRGLCAGLARQLPSRGGGKGTWQQDQQGRHNT